MILYWHAVSIKDQRTIEDYDNCVAGHIGFRTPSAEVMRREWEFNQPNCIFTTQENAAMSLYGYRKHRQLLKSLAQLSFERCLINEEALARYLAICYID